MNPWHPHHPRQLAPAACVALCLLLLPQAALAQPTVRWRCTLADGVPRTVASDLSRSFPEATTQCQPLPAVAEAVPSAAPPPRPLPRQHLVAPRTQTGLGPPWAGLTPALALQIDAASRRERLDPLLVAALVSVESGWRAAARSPRGALGLMQLMPGTAREYGVEAAQDLVDAQLNLAVGTRHLRVLHDRYGDRLDLVLAAYNAGPGAVQRHGGRVPPYAETQAYVQDVLARWRQAHEQLER